MPFDPNKSKVNEDTLSQFIASPIQASLQSVPGIGAHAEKLLHNNDIENTYQLIGSFLLIKKDNSSPLDHANDFWTFLFEIGIISHRSGIVHAIASKVNTMIPGIYEY